MRKAFVALLGCSLGLCGLTCTSDNPTGVLPGTEVAATIIEPSTIKTRPIGAIVPIEWTVANFTGDEALVSLTLESRPSFERTILFGSRRVSNQIVTETYDWDTTGFPVASYIIELTVELPDRTITEQGPVRVLLDGAPAFTFLDPDADLTFGDAQDEPAPDPNDSNSPADPSEDRLVIRWTASDPEGTATATIGLDTDQDHESGNEIELTTDTLAEEETVGTFRWDGQDNGNYVDPGVYYIYAVVDDETNEPLIVEAPGRVTIPDGFNENRESALTTPEEDVELVDNGTPVVIEYVLYESEDTLIDLQIDTDANHTNGNEISLIRQKLIENGKAVETYEFIGNDADGDPVPNGIYFLYLIPSTEDETKLALFADGKIFRRTDEDQPLIALQAPSTNDERSPGGNFRIRWIDDDPSESATIRLVYDDDRFPDEDVETGEPEQEITADRDPAPDGAGDTFTWFIPGSIDPGQYYIFAYIDRDGAAPWDHVDVAPGSIIIPDPTGN